MAQGLHGVVEISICKFNCITVVHTTMDSCTVDFTDKINPYIAGLFTMYVKRCIHIDFINIECMAMHCYLPR